MQIEDRPLEPVEWIGVFAEGGTQPLALFSTYMGEGESARRAALWGHEHMLRFDVRDVFFSLTSAVGPTIRIGPPWPGVQALQRKEPG